VPLRTLYFTITIETLYGQTSSENISATNAVPSTPSAPTVTEAFQRLKIDWSAVSNSDVIGYNIYIGTGANPTTLAGFVNGTSFLYEGTAGTTYYVRIKAVDPFGSGDYSADGSGEAQHLDPAEATTGEITAPLPQGIVWSALGASIGWSTGAIIYEGVTYSISSSAVANKFIYWDKNDAPTTFHGTDTLPIYGADVWVVAIYIATTNSIYPMVTMKKMHAAILEADSITGDLVADGAIDTDQLATDAVTSEKIGDGEVLDQHIVSVSASKILNNTIPDPSIPKGIKETAAVNFDAKLTLGNGEYIYKIVNMGNSKMLACSVDGVYYSSDAGSSWTGVATDPTNVLIDMVYCGNGIAVGIDTLGNVWKSDDYGDTWADTTENAGSDGNCIEYIGNGILLAGADDGIYKSEDYGDSWAQIAVYSANTTALLYLGDGIVIAGTAGIGYVYRSDDYGDTWTLVHTPTGSGEGEVKCFCEVREGEIIVNCGWRYRSLDNGVTWTYESGTIFNRMANMGDGRVLGGVNTGDGGIFKSEDYGLTWAESGSYGYIWAICYAGSWVAAFSECATGDPGIIYKTELWG
jgi:photosystem II stability/assembly factor-like uncharacterized protein